MTRLHIHGIGTLALGVDEPFVDGTGKVAKLPIKEYVRPTVSRRFGHLTKLIYVAASRAIQDAGVEDPGELAIVNSTCIGETKSSIGLAEQIHKTKGALVSPSLIPNSVHNAAAGYLSIGIGNRSPSITVSQGWLSSEAALLAASDLLGAGVTARAIVVCGDEADPAWADKLRDLGAPHLAEGLEREAFQEGAVGLVVGAEPGGRSLGSIAAAVERARPDPEGIANLLEKNGVRPGPDSEVRVRVGAGGAELRSAVAAALGRPVEDIHLDGKGPGTAQSGALVTLACAIRERRCDELLLLGWEIDDLGFLHWVS